MRARARSSFVTSRKRLESPSTPRRWCAVGWRVRPSHEGAGEPRDRGNGGVKSRQRTLSHLHQVREMGVSWRWGCVIAPTRARSPDTGRPTSSHITFGALGDSFYEYLIKVPRGGGASIGRRGPGVHDDQRVCRSAGCRAAVRRPCSATCAPGLRAAVVSSYGHCCLCRQV